MNASLVSSNNFLLKFLKPILIKFGSFLDILKTEPSVSIKPLIHLFKKKLFSLIQSGIVTLFLILFPAGNPILSKNSTKFLLYTTTNLSFILGVKIIFTFK